MTLKSITHNVPFKTESLYGLTKIFVNLRSRETVAQDVTEADVKKGKHSSAAGFNQLCSSCSLGYLA